MADDIVNTILVKIQIIIDNLKQSINYLSSLKKQTDVTASSLGKLELSSARLNKHWTAVNTKLAKTTSTVKAYTVANRTADKASNKLSETTAKATKFTGDFISSVREATNAAKGESTALYQVADAYNAATKGASQYSGRYVTTQHMTGQQVMMGQQPSLAKELGTRGKPLDPSRLAVGWQTVNAKFDEHGKIVGRVQSRWESLDGQMFKVSRTQHRVGDGWKTAVPNVAQKNKLDSFLGKFTKMRWLMVNFAMAAAVVGGALVAMFGPLIKLENEMVDVRKRTGMAGEELENLRTELIYVSKFMPQSAEEIAKLAAVAGQLGIRGTRNIAEFSRVTAMMGTATVYNAEDAALALAKLSSAFELTVSQAENMGSTLNYLANNTAANAKEITEASLKMAAAAHNLGISYELTTAIAATLVSMGEKPSRAGTRMKSVFSSMASNIEAVTNLFRNVTGNIELTGQTIEDRINKDANDTFLTTIQLLSEMETKTEIVKSATEIFGRVGSSVVLSLSSNFLTLKENTIKATDAFKEANSLNKEFQASLSSSTNQWKKFMSGVKADWQETFRGEKGVAWLLGEANVERDAAAVIQSIAGEIETISPEPTMFQKIFRGFATSPFLVNHPLVGEEKRLENVIALKSKLGIELTKEEQAYLKVYRIQQDYLENVKKLGKEEAFNILLEERTKLLNEQTKLFNPEEEKKFYNTVLDYNKKILAVEDTSSAEAIKLVRAKENYIRKYADYSIQQVEALTEEADAAANASDKFGELAGKYLELTESEQEYKDAIDNLIYTTVISRESNEYLKKGLDELQSEYKDTIRVSELRSVANEHLSDTTEEVTEKITDLERAELKLANAEEKVSNTQSLIRTYMDITTEKLNDRITELKATYETYKDAMFEGEAKRLERLDEIELAIKKQQLAELKLGDQSKETSDQLNAEANSYKAWVDTVHEVVRALIKEGNNLSKNVSKAVKEQQTALLSTTRYETTRDKTETDTVLDKLKREQDIAQLEYEIEYGEKHNAIERYIDAKEREGQVEWSSAQQAFDAIDKVLIQIQEQENELSNVEQKWKTAQREADIYGAGGANALNFLDQSITSQITTINGLIGKWQDAKEEVEKYNAEVAREEYKESRSSRSGDYEIIGPVSSAEPIWHPSKTTTNVSWSAKELSKPVEQRLSDNISSVMSSSRYSSSSSSIYPGAIGMFAEGGLVNKPTFSLLGEAGPELVVPLKNLNKSYNQPSSKTVNIQNITLQGIQNNPEEFADEFVNIVKRQLKTS